MASLTGLDFLLFVSGRPDPNADVLRDVETSFGSRLVGFFLPVSWRRSSKPKPGAAAPAPTSPDALPAHLAPPEQQCVAMVLDLARREGRRVTVVNVEDPGAHRSRMERWVGANDVLPLLVRPDGGRLEGLEEFQPARVRQFLVGSR
jgi:hypothetical protein